MATSKKAPKLPRQPRLPTLKQVRFAEVLPTARTLTDAVLDAGYDTSRANAHVIANENLRKPAVQVLIAELQEKTTSALVMSLLRRKERLSELAKPDPEHPDPVKAIAELNRMERVYGPEQPTAPQPVITYVEVVLVSAPEAVAPTVIEARAVTPSRKGP